MTDGKPSEKNRAVISIEPEMTTFSILLSCLDLRKWNVFWEPDLCQAADLIRLASPKVILFSFDPHCRKSAETLEEIREICPRQSGTMIFTHSTFNPDWIDNLVGNFGSDGHFPSRMIVTHLQNTFSFDGSMGNPEPMPNPLRITR